MYLDIVKKLKILDPLERVKFVTNWQREQSLDFEKIVSDLQLYKQAVKARPGYTEALQEISNEVEEYIKKATKQSIRLLEVGRSNHYLVEDLLEALQDLDCDIHHVLSEDDLCDSEVTKYDIVFGPLSSVFPGASAERSKNINNLLVGDGIVIIYDDFLQSYNSDQQYQLSLIEFSGLVLQEISHRLAMTNTTPSNSEREALKHAAFLEAVALTDSILGKNNKRSLSLTALNSIAKDFSVLGKKLLFPNGGLERGTYMVALANKRLPGTPYFLQKLRHEYQRASNDQHDMQEATLNMIAPSNLHPQEVSLAGGGPFVETLAEGYRYERYHTGTAHYDDIENLGEIAARALFEASYVNLKPHSGTQAIQAALLACKHEGRQKILSLSLKPGGHITHSRLTMFNKAMGFEIFHYSADKNFELDYDDILKKAKEHNVDIIITGYSAFPKSIDFKKFREIADIVGARLIADVSHIAGLIAGSAYPNPTTVADVVVFSTSKTLAGPKGGMIVAGDGDDGFLELVSKSLNIGLQSEDHSPSVVAKVAMLTLALKPEFKEYSKQVVLNAKALATALHGQGIPVVGYDERSQGTDSHIVMIDVHAIKDEFNGDNVAKVLEAVGILSNKNLLPEDALSAHMTSGLRLGTSAITLGGAKENTMKELADIIAQTLKVTQVIDEVIFLDQKICQESRRSIESLARKYHRSTL